MTAYEEHLVNNGWSPEEAAIMYQRFSDPSFSRDPMMMREYQPGFLSRRAQIEEAHPVTINPAYTQRIMQANSTPIRTSPIIASTPTPNVRTRNISGNIKKPIRVVAPTFTPKAPVQAVPLEGTPESQAATVEAWRAKNADQLNAAKMYDESIGSSLLVPRSVTPEGVAAFRAAHPELAESIYNYDNYTIPDKVESPSTASSVQPIEQARINRNDMMGTGIQAESVPTSNNISKPTETEQNAQDVEQKLNAEQYLAWRNDIYDNPALSAAYPSLAVDQNAITEAALNDKRITDYQAAQDWFALTAPSLIGAGITAPIIRGLTLLPRARQALTASRLARQAKRVEKADKAVRRLADIRAQKLVEMGKEINENPITGSIRNLRRSLKGDDLAQVALETNPNTPALVKQLDRGINGIAKVGRATKNGFKQLKKDAKNIVKNVTEKPKEFIRNTKPTEIKVNEPILPDPVKNPSAYEQYLQDVKDAFATASKYWWRGWK